MYVYMYQVLCIQYLSVSLNGWFTLSVYDICEKVCDNSTVKKRVSEPKNFSKPKSTFLLCMCVRVNFHNHQHFLSFATIDNTVHRMCIQIVGTCAFFIHAFTYGIWVKKVKTTKALTSPKKHTDGMMMEVLCQIPKMEIDCEISCVYVEMLMYICLRKIEGNGKKNFLSNNRSTSLF